MKNPWLIIVVLVVVLIGGSVWYSNSVSKSYDEGVTVSAHEKGKLDSTVVVTEFSDFQCPACGNFEPIVDEMFAKYGDKIKFEYKHFPLPMHQFAPIASRAAEAAGQQGKFFEYHDVLFKNQDEWSKSTNPTGLFVKYATNMGLDVTKFKNQMQAPSLEAYIKADMAQGQKQGVTGTPTFFLNGVKMNLTTADDFIKQIDEAVNPKVDFALPGEADPQLKVVPVTDVATSEVAPQ